MSRWVVTEWKERRLASDSAHFPLAPSHIQGLCLAERAATRPEREWRRDTVPRSRVCTGPHGRALPRSARLSRQPGGPGPRLWLHALRVGACPQLCLRRQRLCSSVSSVTPGDTTSEVAHAGPIWRSPRPPSGFWILRLRKAVILTVTVYHSEGTHINTRERNRHTGHSSSSWALPAVTERTLSSHRSGT